MELGRTRIFQRESVRLSVGITTDAEISLGVDCRTFRRNSAARVLAPPATTLIGIEKLSDEELEQLEERYAEICAQHRVRNVRLQRG